MPLNGLAPLTELEAVNEILGTGAESPVSSLDEAQVLDASLAMSILRTTSTEVQTQGWWFNEEENYPLTPDEGGFISLPRNTLKVDSLPTQGVSLVQRGLRLYDRAARSYVFASPVTLTLTFGLPFDELPASARVYVTVRAARKFQDRYYADAAVHSYTTQDEAVARSVLLEEEITARDPNMLSGSSFTQGLRSGA